MSQWQAAGIHNNVKAVYQQTLISVRVRWSEEGNGMAWMRIDAPEHMVKIKFWTDTGQYFATF